MLPVIRWSDAGWCYILFLPFLFPYCLAVSSSSFLSIQPSRTRRGWRSLPSWRRRGSGWWALLEPGRDRAQTYSSFLSVKSLEKPFFYLFYKLFFFPLSSPPSHHVASRCPDRVWRSSGTTQSSSTSLPSRKLPCRWDTSKTQIHLYILFFSQLFHTVTSGTTSHVEYYVFHIEIIVVHDVV